MANEEFSIFDALFSKNVPHILERIFFSLDYNTYKNCLEVSEVWHDLLTSESYQRRGRSVFQDELLDDEKKLHSPSHGGNVREVRKLLSTGMLDVNSVWGYHDNTIV